MRQAIGVDADDDAGDNAEESEQCPQTNVAECAFASCSSASTTRPKRTGSASCVAAMTTPASSKADGEIFFGRKQAKRAPINLDEVQGLRGHGRAGQRASIRIFTTCQSSVSKPTVRKWTDLATTIEFPQGPAKGLKSECDRVTARRDGDGAKEHVGSEHGCFCSVDGCEPPRLPNVVEHDPAAVGAFGLDRHRRVVIGDDTRASCGFERRRNIAFQQHRRLRVPIRPCAVSQDLLEIGLSAALAKSTRGMARGFS